MTVLRGVGSVHVGPSPDGPWVPIGWADTRETLTATEGLGSEGLAWPEPFTVRMRMLSSSILDAASVFRLFGIAFTPRQKRPVLHNGRKPTARRRKR